MNKLDNKIINGLKILSLDMIKKAGSGDVGISMASAHILYTLFSKHIKLNRHNSSWINRDRVIVSNRLLPLVYSILHVIYQDYNIDKLLEFKEFNSNVKGYANNSFKGIDMGSITDGDIIASATGISLGERYLEELIKLEDSKNNLIDFHTFCICTEEDIMNGLSYEAMSFAGVQKLNKLIFIVIKDGISKDSATKEAFNENLIDRFVALKYNVEEINDSYSSLNGAIGESLDKKVPSAIIIRTTYGKDTSYEGSNSHYNLPLGEKEITELKGKYQTPDGYFTKDDYDYLAKCLDKRMEKELNRWEEKKLESLKDLKIKQVIDFLESGKCTIKFSPENIKIKDNYEEELIISNSKIFNIFASKSPFILSASNDNFIYTKSNISKSQIMSNLNPTGRNIMLGSRNTAMGFIAAGLSSLGFKVILSTPLVFSDYLKLAIKLSVLNNLDINFIFTQDTIMNTFEDFGIGALEEVNSLRLIPGLVNFRPCDIDEIIGVYEIISNYRKPCTIVIGSEKTKKLKGTNYKYVMAGAYRVKKEREIVNANIIASGKEVSLAIAISEELAVYGIDFRVITMPSMELFELQNIKYRHNLINPQVKTFVIEFGSNTNWYKYASGEDYIISVKSRCSSGTKEEILKASNLDKDAIKAKIMGLLKK